MLRFGVFDAADYRAAPPGAPWIVRRFFTSRRVSFELLRTKLPPSAAELNVFQSLVANLRLSSGVYRTTYRGRFQELDGAIDALLAARHAPESPLEVHDWAASDCLTSAEWAVSLFQRFPRASLIASDLILFLVEATLPDGSIFFLEPSGQLLQYVRRPFVIRLVPPEPRLMLVNHWIGRRAEARLAALQLSIPQAWLDSNDTELTTPAAALRKVPLSHPEARLLAERDPRFTMRPHSVFEPLGRPADVIRTMNIFNRAYLPPERLRDGARAVWKSLKSGGCWIVGRTDEDNGGGNKATIFERTESAFRVMARIGGGSEIEDYVECEAAT